MEVCFVTPPERRAQNFSLDLDNLKRIEAKLKHLEFIQAVIARMATNSFLFKGWAITLAASLSGFGAVQNKRMLFLIALLTTVVFWGLDGYYLWLERGFIELHNNVSATDGSQIDFSMTIDKENALRRWLGTCLRPHLWVFYGAMALSEFVGVIVIRSN